MKRINTKRRVLRTVIDSQDNMYPNFIFMELDIPFGMQLWYVELGAKL